MSNRPTPVSELRSESSSRLPDGAGSDGGSALPHGAGGDVGNLFPGAVMDGGQLRIPIGPDSAQPSYLTLNPDGTVGAEFSGHVRARGLDLVAGTTDTPPSDRRVRWLDETDNDKPVHSHYTYRQSISGGTASIGRSESIDVDGPFAGSSRRAFLESAVYTNAGGLNLATLMALATHDLGSTGVGQQVVIIDSEGRSSFVQLANFFRKVVLHGPYSFTIPSAAPNGGSVADITVPSWTGTGVTFRLPFGSCNEPGGRLHYNVFTLSPTSIRAAWYNPTALASTTCTGWFAFIDFTN